VGNLLPRAQRLSDSALIRPAALTGVQASPAPLQLATARGTEPRRSLCGSVWSPSPSLQPLQPWLSRPLPGAQRSRSGFLFAAGHSTGARADCSAPTRSAARQRSSTTSRSRATPPTSRTGPARHGRPARRCTDDPAGRRLLPRRRSVQPQRHRRHSGRHKTLVAVQSANGRLYRINPATGSATRIQLANGESVPNGDGIDLSPDLASGTVRRRLTDGDFDVPTTIDDFGGRLYAVNARFGVSDPGNADFKVVQLRKPAG
jgi:hypothetical protein